MRLIDTTTGKFRWFQDPLQIQYAILSHVWAKDGDVNYARECTYRDVFEIQKTTPSGSILPLLPAKVQRFCEVARNDGFSLAWVDSCCIDKSSSSELSESINSMFSWYRNAGACYVFLADVEPSQGGRIQEEQFKKSRWFTRGWTLQELLAPYTVIFLSSRWSIIGSKHTLSNLIQSITSVDVAILLFDQPLSSVSVARRMSWAASRQTTLVEDVAYSLMGIFGVNMPTMYGEGHAAFRRLQEEILRRNPDQTILAWGLTVSRDPSSGLSPSCGRGLFSRLQRNRAPPTRSTTLPQPIHSPTWASDKSDTPLLPTSLEPVDGGRRHSEDSKQPHSASRWTWPCAFTSIVRVLVVSCSRCLSKIFFISPARHPPLDGPVPPQHLLAFLPSDFTQDSPRLTPIPFKELAVRLGIPSEAAYQDVTCTPLGLSIRLPLALLAKDSPDNRRSFIAPLACQDEQKRVLALLLSPQPFRRSMSIPIPARASSRKSSRDSGCLVGDRGGTGVRRVLFLSPEQLEEFRSRAVFRMLDVSVL